MSGIKKSQRAPILSVDEAVQAVREATKARVLADKRWAAAEAESESARQQYRTANSALAKARKALNAAMAR